MKGELINPEDLDEGIEEVLRLIINFVDNHLGKLKKLDLKEEV